MSAYFKVILKRLYTRLILSMMLFLYVITLNVYALDNLFKIEIDPAIVYEKPNKTSIKLKSLYQAQDIKIITLIDKWVQIEFLVEQEPLIGWVEKTFLKSQVINNDEIQKETKFQIMDIDLDTSVKDLFIVNSSADEIKCIKSDASDYVNGCLVNINVELKSDPKSLFADVLCIAEFDVISNVSKRLVREKKVRTPLKFGKGAVRLQVAMLPLFDKSVMSVKLLSHKCHVERMIQ